MISGIVIIIYIVVVVVKRRKKYNSHKIVKMSDVDYNNQATSIPKEGTTNSAPLDHKGINMLSSFTTYLIT